jgi:hypothetical protein
MDRMGIHSSMRLGWVVAFSALMAFYYFIPELEITDSRYVLGTSDAFVRTGSLDMRRLVKADANKALVDNYYFLIRSTDLAPDVIATARKAGIGPFGKGRGADFYILREIASFVPGAAAGISDATYPLLPLYPNWPSFLCAPVSVLTSALGLPVYDGVAFHDDRNALYQRILAAAVAALTIVFFYAAARCVIARPLAMALAAWLGAGLIASSTSRALWSDTFALPLCFAGLTVFMRVVVARRATSYWPFLLAALLSLAFMMKPLYAIPSAMLGLLVVLAPEIPLRSKVSFAATCLAFAILFVVTSFATYGALLPPYFAPTRVNPFDPSHILGVLVSPSRGLLWFMPSALLLFFTPFFVLRDRRLLVASAIAVAAVTLVILSISGFATWWGGFSYGPRLFQPALPALAFLALIMAQAAGNLGRPAQAALLSLFGVVACWEAFVHIGGVSSGRGMQWNVSPVSVDDAPERLWDWSDPQFLAAFLKRRPIRDLSPLPRDAWVQMPSACSDRFAGDGISGREAEFRWTDGNEAEILFAPPPGKVRSLTMEVLPLVDPGHPQQHVRIDINGTEIGAVSLTEPRWTPLQFNLPPGVMKSQNALTLRLPDAHRPPASGDTRLLGVAIRRFALTSEPGASSLPVADICK